jgi:hypothetical protein
MRGQEERTNTFLLRHCKIFRGALLKRERNGKNGARSGTTTILPYLGTSFIREK